MKAPEYGEVHYVTPMSVYIRMEEDAADLERERMEAEMESERLEEERLDDDRYRGRTDS